MILDISDQSFRAIFQNEDLYLPIRWDGKDFYHSVEVLFKTYLDAVQNEVMNENAEEHAMDFQSTYELRSRREYLRKIRRFCKMILSAIREYLNGFPAKAYTHFSGLMEKMMETPFQVYNKTAYELFENHTDAYRQDPLDLFRVALVPDAILYDRARVFHTPYSLRAKISTNRFSIAGFPSLYLGTSLPLCCEELGYPQTTMQALAARFKIEREYAICEREIEVIELGIKPQDFFLEENPWDSGSTRSRSTRLGASDEKRGRYLLWYPLIAACSFIRADKRDPFAAEYIVPQLLMQWIRTKIEKNVRQKNEKLVGIRYFSCASLRASEMGFNYVFPASGKQISPDIPFCPVLNKAFVLTKPKYLRDYESIAACEDALRNDYDLKHVYP